MSNVWAVAESAIGAVGAGTWYVIAQGLPEAPIEWTNLSASVVLGGLCVFLVTRIIPQMHDKFNERLEKRDAALQETLDKIHAVWQSAIDRICDKLDKLDK